jgi:hypothetical protein
MFASILYYILKENNRIDETRLIFTLAARIKIHSWKGPTFKLQLEGPGLRVFTWTG